MEVIVDLNTRILPTGHQVFMSRPGERYRIYREIVDSEIVAPEFPGLIIDGDLESDRFLAKLRMARALKVWHDGHRVKDEPSRLVDDYLQGRGDVGLSQLKGAAFGYFLKAKSGDLVLVPPSTADGLAYIGEFVDEPNRVAALRIQRLFGDDLLPGRRVRWLASIPSRLLPSDVREIVKKPNIFVQLPRSSFPFIYERAYKNYVHDDKFTAQFDVVSAEFDSQTDLAIQWFVNYFALILKNIDERSPVKSNIQYLALADLGVYAPQLKTNVNSPGSLVYISVLSVPIVAAVLYGLAVTVGPETPAIAKADRLKIVNTLGSDEDECTSTVRESTLSVFLHLDEWPEACEIARRIQNATGMKSQVEITKDGPP
jgi:hypothetical protein